MSITITEIIDRSSQGITLPFLCRGDNGLLYYVKGNRAGFRALISEWIAGHLGKRLGLPVPDFAQAFIPKELVRLSAREDIHELGAGFGFASQFVADADELTYLFIRQIDESLRSQILLFDWWVGNGDRTLTENGGNPNILWVHREHKPYVIDHNLAFDESALADFWSEHIFASSRAGWKGDFRRSSEALMKAALRDLPAWWEAMPPEWTEAEAGITLESVKNLLWRFEKDPVSFWREQ